MDPYRFRLRLESRVAELEGRVAELETAIRTHRDQRDDDRCWLDDAALYAVLPDTKAVDTLLPPHDEFMQSCSRFWMQRQAPCRGKVVTPDFMTIRQLEEEIARLRNAVALPEGCPRAMDGTEVKE